VTPPWAELRDLWREAVPLVDVVSRSSAGRVLGKRRLAAVADAYVVRVLPERTLPWWPASLRAYRLAVPSYQPDGLWTSFEALALDGTVPSARTPIGCSGEGLLHADQGGLELLHRRRWVGLRCIVLGESLVDYLAWSGVAWGRLARHLQGATNEKDRLKLAREHLDIAVLGAVAGDWSGLAGVEWPEGVKVYAVGEMEAATQRARRAAEGVPVTALTTESIERDGVLEGIAETMVNL
jgi:hypothetical protein